MQPMIQSFKLCNAPSLSTFRYDGIVNLQLVPKFLPAFYLADLLFTQSKKGTCYKVTL